MAAHNNVTLSLLYCVQYYSYSSCCEVQVVNVAYTVAIDWLNEIPFVGYETQILCLTKYDDWLLIPEIFL
jgi:hypothetical protein